MQSSLNLSSFNSLSAPISSVNRSPLYPLGQLTSSSPKQVLPRFTVLRNTSMQQATISLDKSRLLPISPALKSTALVTHIMASGCLNTDSERKMCTDVDVLFKAACTQTHDLWTQVKQNIDKFQQEIEQMRDNTEQILENLQGNHAQASALIEMSQRIMHLKMKVVSKFVEFSSQSNQGCFKNYKNLMELLFYNQSQEIELLTHRFAFLMDTQAHELNTLVVLQSQQLEIEEQVFDQFFKFSQLCEKKDRQAYKNAQTIKDLQIKMEANQQQILQKEQEMQQLLVSKKLQMSEQLQEEKHRIDANTRCRLAQIAAENSLA